MDPRLFSPGQLNKARVPPQGDPPSSGGRWLQSHPVPLLHFCPLPDPTVLITDPKFNPGRLENTDHPPPPASGLKKEKAPILPLH